MTDTQYPMIPLDLLYYFIWLQRQRQRQRQAQQAAARAEQLRMQDQGGGGTDSTGEGPGMSGPMTAAERSTLSNLSGGVVGIGTELGAWDAPTGRFGGVAKSVANAITSAALQAAGYLGVNPMTAASILGNTILGVDKIMSPEARQKLGIQTERVAVAPTEADLQGMSDKYGFGMPTGYGFTSGLPGLGGVSVGPRGTGTTGPSDDATTPDAPSVTNPDALGGSVDAGQSDTGGTSDSTGGSRGGEGSDRKKGGVFRASRPKTERITWGERGTAPGGRSGETAIFIPDRFQLPGLQENERAVRMALRRSLADILAGRRRST